ncbi:MAG: hypothetical protein K2X28_02880 [Alphaproteobacteria bacterium]|nr:hypothetical protein [Alphaproteobacteria bacterium]
MKRIFHMEVSQQKQPSLGFAKILKIFLLIWIASSISTYAGDDEEEIYIQRSSPPSYINLDDDDPNAVDIRREDEEVREIRDPDFSMAISILNVNPEHPIRKKLNLQIHQLALKPKLLKKLGEEGLQNTAVIIYNPSKKPPQHKNRPLSWTNTEQFLEEFDKCFFRKDSKFRNMSRAITVPFGVIIGLLEPGGIVATTWYLWGETLYDKLVEGELATGITIGTLLILTPPCIVQSVEFTENLANFVFGNKELTPSKDDVKPHIQKLGTTVDLLEKLCCCKSFRLSTFPIYSIVSALDAAIVTLVYSNFFYTAEFQPNVNGELFFYIRALPFALFYFSNTFDVNYKFFTDHEHQKKSNMIRMVAEKKNILRRRLETMKWHINSSKSGGLVHELYTLMQGELEKTNKNDGEEHISALSLLFLKLSRTEMFKELQQELSAQAMNSTEEEIKNIVSEMETMPIQGMSNLITDIDRLPSETTMASFLKQAATFAQGLSTVGELIATSYGINQLALSLGLDPASAEYLSYVAAIAHCGLSAFTQSDIQKTTFLRTQKAFSTCADFWPVRWGVNCLSAATALFLSVPYPCIINEALGDGTPPYIRAFLALSTVPKQFSSFYNFCHTEYGELVTKIATSIPIKTVKQERAWLNELIDKMNEWIGKLDQNTTEQLYNLSQEGL